MVSRRKEWDFRGFRVNLRYEVAILRKRKERRLLLFGCLQHILYMAVLITVIMMHLARRTALVAPPAPPHPARSTERSAWLATGRRAEASVPDPECDHRVRRRGRDPERH